MTEINGNLLSSPDLDAMMEDERKYGHLSVGKRKKLVFEELCEDLERLTSHHQPSITSIMTTTKLTPGLYRLKKTIQNPHPDRRKKQDFNALVEWKEGHRIFVDETRHPNDEKDQKVLRLWEQGGYTFYGYYENQDEFSLIAPHLEKIEETPSDWCEREEHRTADILDQLFKSGKISMEDVIQAAKDFDESLND